MAASRGVHQVSPAGATTPAAPGPSETPRSQFSDDGDSFLAGLADSEVRGPLTDPEGPTPTTAPSTESRHIPATEGGQDDDAQSSVSEATAVLAGLRTDPGSRAQARARELEDLSRFCADATNRITCSGAICEWRAHSECALLCRVVGRGRLVSAHVMAYGQSRVHARCWASAGSGLSLLPLVSRAVPARVASRASRRALAVGHRSPTQHHGDEDVFRLGFDRGRENPPSALFVCALSSVRLGLRPCSVLHLPVPLLSAWLSSSTSPSSSSCRGRPRRCWASAGSGLSLFPLVSRAVPARGASRASRRALAVGHRSPTQQFSLAFSNSSDCVPTCELTRPRSVGQPPHCRASSWKRDARLRGYSGVSWWLSNRRSATFSLASLALFDLTTLPDASRRLMDGRFWRWPRGRCWAGWPRSGAPGAAQPVPLGPGTAGGPGMALRHDHVAFLTPVGTTEAPARDVVRLLKTNIDPVAKGINDVTFRYTRYGVTVFSNTRQSLVNMRTAIEENTVTCAALTVRVPEKRNPHVRFSGVDPDITADEFLRLLADRNPSLQLNLDTCRVGVSLRERAGTMAYVAEVDPEAFRRIMGCPRLSIGWTVIRSREDLHVTTCTFCASYGHGRRTCPLSNEPARATCMRCATEGHTGRDFRVREGDAAVCCAACRRAGMEAAGHPAGHPQCPLIMDKVNLDHARLATGALCDRMLQDSLHLAAASDPYRPSKQVPRLPAGFTVISDREDPRAIIIIRQPPYDVCPILVTNLVVAVYCQARDFDFVLVSAYSPTHTSMESTLRAMDEVLSRSRSPNVILAGDFNAKHLVWGQRRDDDRGARLLEFAAAHDLLVLNDPQSQPTYETSYAASWIDVTLATSSAITPGYTWEVLDDSTYSEHRNIVVRSGNTTTRPRKRLTRFAQAELLRALAQETWFRRVVGSDLASPTALDAVLAGLYRTYSGHVKRHLRPVKSSAGGNSWWNPWLAEEKRRVNASRRRFQRCRNDDLRAVFRVNYNAALARYRMHIRQAKEQFEAECNSACSRHSVFSTPFREAFGRTRSFKLLPPLEKEDGAFTETHLESASLLLRTQIAIDDSSKDLLEHVHVRAMAASPYTTAATDVPFTKGEVRQVIARISPRSAPGPDDISPTVVKGLFAVQPEFVTFLMNSALKLGYFPRLWQRTARRRLQSELYRRWAEEWASDNSDTAIYNWVPDPREIPQCFPSQQIACDTTHSTRKVSLVLPPVQSSPRCHMPLRCPLSVGHVDCSFTNSLAQRLQPRPNPAQDNFVAILNSPRNRAILIRLVRLASPPARPSHLLPIHDEPLSLHTTITRQAHAPVSLADTPATSSGHGVEGLTCAPSGPLDHRGACHNFLELGQLDSPATAVS
ncbi:hypothetical protein HPB52_023796 [Rhipicephalus sanguineus]|uniref:Endonuclease/exonuclease/phosphatase domain-containing protein n=1 Tax=Rhipicephalus sanguineus TaxID=34632 RepID=A0A9D4Q3D7_RHISA|nr:hypothetical protein HPB52_023796 [Rhipicephalus sanguineus]